MSFTPESEELYRSWGCRIFCWDRSPGGASQEIWHHCRILLGNAAFLLGCSDRSEGGHRRQRGQCLLSFRRSALPRSTNRLASRDLDFARFRERGIQEFHKGWKFYFRFAWQIQNRSIWDIHQFQSEYFQVSGPYRWCFWSGDTQRWGPCAMRRSYIK